MRAEYQAKFKERFMTDFPFRGVDGRPSKLQKLNDSEHPRSSDVCNDDGVVFSNVCLSASNLC